MTRPGRLEWWQEPPSEAELADDFDPDGPRIGSLCSGYGGLEMAVQAVLGGETAWVSDIDKGACKILAHRFPGVPNIGDMTKVYWSEVEPVDVLTGGTPCQDLSHAGKRAGMTEGTRSNLWVAMREAIVALRPSLVVWENVSGAYSAEADSELESDPGLLAGTRRRHGEPVLRALGRVLGDLASLGYVGGWHGLRAADVGAPHGRLRVFVVAYPASNPWRLEHGDGGAAGHADLPRLEGRQPAGERASQRAARPDGLGTSTDGLTLLPTPVADHSRGLPSSGTDYQSLPNAVCALLPTPMVGDAASACNSTATRHKIPPTGVHAGDTLTDVIRGSQEWGQYEPAIRRWEATLGRNAPPPTETGPKGNPRLAAAFSEFMMGLPAGWVTDVPGITRNEALRALGNGVVPAQAEAAIRFLLGGVAAPSTEPAELLPTPSVADGTGGHATRSGARSNELLLPGVAKMLGGAQ